MRKIASDMGTGMVAEMLGVSDQTIRTLCESGAFGGAYRVSAGARGRWRIPAAAVERYRAARAKDSAPKREAGNLDPVELMDRLLIKRKGGAKCTTGKGRRIPGANGGSGSSSGARADR